MNESQVRQAYLLEKKLAEKLRNSSREERKILYNSVYAEYYENFPQHPFIHKNNEAIVRSANNQMQLLKSFLKPTSFFLEIGTGTGCLSFQVAEHVDTVYMVDISAKPTQGASFPQNVELLISNGVNVPTSMKRVDIVYSNHVMEHLHPDDALEQIQDIYQVLTHGGIYICRTPHRYLGPHDISKHFDDVATCFHLKEYTVGELTELFQLAGFKKIRYVTILKGIKVPLPLLLIRSAERLFANYPFVLRKKLFRNLPLRLLFNNFIIVGTK